MNGKHGGRGGLAGFAGGGGPGGGCWLGGGSGVGAIGANGHGEDSSPDAGGNRTRVREAERNITAVTGEKAKRLKPKAKNNEKTRLCERYNIPRENMTQHVFLIGTIRPMIERRYLRPPIFKS